MSVVNIPIPIDTIAEAVVSFIWGTLQAPLGLQLCEQAPNETWAELGDTPEKIAERFPAVFVVTPGWESGQVVGSPQTGMGQSQLDLRLTHLFQLPLSTSPPDQAKESNRRARILGEAFSHPEGAWPFAVSLPPGVIKRRCWPPRIVNYSAADLSDFGLRLVGVDVNLAIQYASFGKR